MNKYFSNDELKCHHCGECHIPDAFLLELESIREECGFPFILRSAYRCVEYDNTFNGDGNHPKGAVDVEFQSSHELYLIIEACRKRGITRFGIKFEGVNPTRGFIHFDHIFEHPQEVVWGYK